jgi:hypothetical protein
MSLDDLRSLLETIEHYSVSTWVTFAGLILCFFALQKSKEERASEGRHDRLFVGRRDQLFVVVGVSLIVLAQMASFVNLRLVYFRFGCTRGVFGI